jgi:hypothetical protein
MKGRFQCVLMVGLKAGRGGRCGAAAGGAALRSRGGEPKEGENPDRRGPTGSEREEIEEGEVGRRRCLGRKRNWTVGREKAGGLKERKGRGVKGVWVFFFFF